MATVNIAADMNEAETVTIADAGAAAGSHLFQFFTDGKNVFNIATQDLSGAAVDDVTVNVGTSYVFDISAAQAQLLNGVASTYKQYLLDGVGGKTLLNEGSVTVTALIGSTDEPLAPYINGNNITKTSGPLTLTAEHDIIFGTPATAVVYTLPDARKIPGKRFEIKMNGAGSIGVKTPDGATLITLATAGDNCMIRAKDEIDADNWEVFFQYIQP